MKTLETASITPKLNATYVPVAVYYEDADAIEYLRSSEPCFYRRIDTFLTLALDMDNRKLIGFRLKGFRNFYIRHLATVHKTLDVDFVMLVSVVEKLVEVLADDLIDNLDNSSKRQAYADVHKIALEDKVELHELPRAA